MTPFPIVALIGAALFTGAAGYITFVEHPARLRLDDTPLLMQWQPSYARALPIQSGLAIVGGVAGIASCYQCHGWLWIAGALVLLGNWPFTLIAIMPTNRRLKAWEPGQASAESRRLLLAWGAMHNVRTALGAIATALFAVALALC